MKTILWTTAACAVALCFAVAADDKPAAKGMKPQAAAPQAITISASDVKWGPAPAAFPPGAQLAVLHGDPS